MGIATIDAFLMQCLEWTSHVSVHANLKVPHINYKLLTLLHAPNILQTRYKWKREINVNISNEIYLLSTHYKLLIDQIPE